MDTIGWLIHTLESRLPETAEDRPEPPRRARPARPGLLDRFRAAARRPLPR
ncbi:hypothetical protein [Inquilinus sp. Marseille-Q2685]|uniref:hypothetical protein n=1 Tax=Inquilinus sp. Marseille-Q2685 TaxID=2866581 RepID=UPI001CE3EE05|nr:hypothetical protein [Inquilinus sp. Marseille-Q2685]